MFVAHANDVGGRLLSCVNPNPDPENMKTTKTTNSEEPIRPRPTSGPTARKIGFRV